MQTLFRSHKYIAFMIIVNKSMIPRASKRLNIIFTSSEYGKNFCFSKYASGTKVKMIEIIFSAHMRLFIKKFNIVKTPALYHLFTDG